jgi:tetratricopeptide (TPR) repeat protein
MDCQLYGMQPRGRHLTNLFFHLANTMLLFLFLNRTTGVLWPSALAAALVSSWGQAGYWRNSETLFTHSIRVMGDNYLAYHHLGMAFNHRGSYPQAIASARQMRLDEAVEMFKNAIRLTPGNVNFHRNLALAYNQQGGNRPRKQSWRTSNGSPGISDRQGGAEKP